MHAPRPLFFASLAATLAAAATACILFVPNRDVGLACHFAGSDTACGQCVVRSCQDVVNACCGDELCAANDMPSLESCASGQSCTVLVKASGRAADITNCIRSSCSEACSRTTGSCVRNGEDGCRCTTESPFSDGGAPVDDGSTNGGSTEPVTTCNGDNFGLAAGACCAFSGWPDGGSCACLPIRCLELSDNTNSCVCGLYSADHPGFTEMSTCSLGQPCCQRAGACGCNETECTDAETHVSECTVEAVAKSIGCENGVRVPHCQ
jgi:hypothetical protein